MTDSNGQFVVAASDLATDSFYLLQATYQDVNYHAPVKFDDRGQARVDITVYDATRTAPPVRIQSARIILRAEGDKVHVQEMFAHSQRRGPAAQLRESRRHLSLSPRQDLGRSHRRGGRLDEHAAAAAREPRQRAGGLQYSVPPQAGPDGDDGGLRWRLRFEQAGPRGLRRLPDRQRGAAGFALQPYRGLPAVQGRGRRCGDGKPEISGGKRAAQRPTRRQRQRRSGGQ